MRHARRVTVLLAAALSIGVFACGGSNASKNAGNPAKTTAGAGSAGRAALSIKNFSYQPNPLQAKAGDTITITNQDGTNHTVTADDKSFDTGQFSGGSKTIKVTKAGTVAFHCNVHDYMHGTIQVTR